MQQGGAYINNGKVTDLEHKVSLAHLATETMLVVRSGKEGLLSGPRRLSRQNTTVMRVATIPTVRSRSIISCIAG